MIFINSLTAFKQIFHERFNNLVIYCVGMGVPYEQAKDIAQDSFIKLWENRSSISNPTSYLFASVRNSSINYLKSKANTNKQLQVEELKNYTPDNSSFDEAMEYFHKVEEAYKKIQQLTGRCKDIFCMVYIEKMKIKEVAAELDISENTVKTYLKRAKETLRIATAIIIGTITLLIGA